MTSMRKTTMHTTLRTLASFLLPALLAGAVATSAQAQAPAVKVERAWARATVPGQQGTGAFMTLTAREASQLVGVASPAAGVAEVHEMKMDGGVMRMRAVPHIDLPAGQPVELKPGGFHLMLMDLKAPLAKDSTVPVTLLLRNAQGVQSKLELRLPVQVQAQAPGAAPGHKH